MSRPAQITNWSVLTAAIEVATEPVVTIPSAMLVGPNGQMVPDQRFMVFMIDIDVIQRNVATTVLHWFQPDLIMEQSAAQVPAQVPAPASAPAPPAGPPVVPPIVPQGAGSEAPPTSTIGALQPPPGMPSLEPLLKAKEAAASLGLPPSVRLIIAPKETPKEKSITDQTLPANSPDGQASYFGPGPPPGPPHRYVQVLFAQPKNFSIPTCYQDILTNPNDPNKSKMMRLGFDIMGFLKAAKVNPRPLAGNYFRATNPIPGSLTQNAARTRLVDAMCAAETGMGMAMGAPPGRLMRFSA